MKGSIIHVEICMLHFEYEIMIGSVCNNQILFFLMQVPQTSPKLH